MEPDMTDDIGKETLNKMSELLAEQGWTQGGKFRSLDGRYCIRRALHKVTHLGGDHLFSSAAEYDHAAWRAANIRLERALAYRPARSMDRVVSFNDDPNTTYEDVQLLLKKAAED
jgi:hypothetical protein